MRFVFLGFGSVIVAMLFVNFYSLLQATISQSDLLKLSRPNPIQLSTATLPPTRETTSPIVLPAVQTQSEVEAKPAAQVPTKVEPAVEAPPEVPAEVEPAAQAKPNVPAKVEPAARAARAQVSSIDKQSRQQRAAQSTEPSWSRDADSFITYLFFGTEIHAARAEARPNRVWFRHQRQNRSNKFSIKGY